MKWLIALALAARAFACQPVEGDNISGKDLAAANTAFATLDPDLDFGPAPLAGVSRVFRAEELLRIAKQNGIVAAGPVSETCFVRTLEFLSPEILAPVLLKALSLDGAKVEVLDYSRFGVPRGELEFTRSGLSSSGIWHGRVLYGENHSASVWAKVKVTAPAKWVEAAAPIETGKTIDAAQLVLRTGLRFPFGPAPVDSIDLAAGHMALRTLRPGSPIYASMLTMPREVERGDAISVEASSGDVHIEFDSIAGSAGRKGDWILIRNPENGRYFKARVEGKGKVSITP